MMAARNILVRLDHSREEPQYGSEDQGRPEHGSQTSCCRSHVKGGTLDMKMRSLSIYCT